MRRRPLTREDSMERIVTVEKGFPRQTFQTFHRAGGGGLEANFSGVTDVDATTEFSSVKDSTDTSNLLILNGVPHH